MKIGKKNFCFVLCLISLFSLFFAGCSHSSSPLPPSGKKKILSTIAQIGSLAAAIGGERVECQVLVRGELNPHSYELVKGDEEKIGGADLIFYHGLGLEHGASVAALLKTHPRAFGVGESILNRYPEKILWLEEVVDPHLWMDVSLWREAVDPMVEKMGAVDPEGKELYRANGERLKQEMGALDEAMHLQLQKIPSSKRYLVTSHDAFRYFARRYLADPGEIDWEKRFTAPEGLAPDGQLNPLDLQHIIDHLKEFHIEVVFPESNVSRDSIRKVVSAAKDWGLKVRLCQEPLYGDSLRGTYLEAMGKNASVIAHHLEPSP